MLNTIGSIMMFTTDTTTDPVNSLGSFAFCCTLNFLLCAV